MGQAPHLHDFIITLDGIEYPGANSEVYIGQEIKNIKFRIKNKTANVEDNFNLIIEMVDKHKNHISTIGEQEISLGAYNHKISK